MALVDPYIDESIGELRNLLDAKSGDKLREREPQIVFANETELESLDIPGATYELNQIVCTL